MSTRPKVPPPPVPGAPSNVSFPDVGYTFGRVIWEEPAEPDGLLLGYKVTCRPADSADVNIAHELPRTAGLQVSGGTPAARRGVVTARRPGAESTDRCRRSRQAVVMLLRSDGAVTPVPPQGGRPGVGALLPVPGVCPLPTRLVSRGAGSGLHRQFTRGRPQLSQSQVLRTGSSSAGHPAGTARRRSGTLAGAATGFFS